jgi:hypothetical protein
LPLMSIKVVILVSFLLSHIANHLHIMDVKIPFGYCLCAKTIVFAWELNEPPLIWEMLLPNTIVLWRS